MALYKLLAFSDPVKGKEAEYNEWYTNQHLKDVVAVPGFVSAQRFKLRTISLGSFSNGYLTIYNINCDDPEKAIGDVNSLTGTDAMIISSAIDLDGVNFGIFEPISEEVYSREFTE